MPNPVDYYSPSLKHFHPRRHRVLKSLARLLSACLLLLLIAGAYRVVRPAFASTRQDWVRSMQHSLCDQAELFRQQHGRPADFVRYPLWEQFCRSTAADGTVIMYGPGAFGPLVSTYPYNPLNGLLSVATVAGPGTTDPILPTPVGWVFYPDTDQILATDGTGRHIYRPGANPRCGRLLLQSRWSDWNAYPSRKTRLMNTLAGVLELYTHRDGADPLWFLLIPLGPPLLLTLIPLLLILRTLRRWCPPPGTITNPST